MGYFQSFLSIQKSITSHLHSEIRWQSFQQSKYSEEDEKIESYYEYRIKYNMSAAFWMEIERARWESLTLLKTGGTPWAFTENFWVRIRVKEKLCVLYSVNCMLYDGIFSSWESVKFLSFLYVESCPCFSEHQNGFSSWVCVSDRRALCHQTLADSTFTNSHTPTVLLVTAFKMKLCLPCVYREKYRTTDKREILASVHLSMKNSKRNREKKKESKWNGETKKYDSRHLCVYPKLRWRSAFYR